VIDGDGAAPSEAPAQPRATVERATEESRPAPAVAEPSTEKPIDAEAPAPARAEAPAPVQAPAPAQTQAPATPAPAGAPPSTGPGTVVKMPALGESVTEGTVTRWLKQVGETVEADEPLLEVSTDKVDTEIPSPAAGTLLEIKVDQDETVPV